MLVSGRVSVQWRIYTNILPQKNTGFSVEFWGPANFDPTKKAAEFYRKISSFFSGQTCDMSVIVSPTAVKFGEVSSDPCYEEAVFPNLQKLMNQFGAKIPLNIFARNAWTSLSNLLWTVYKGKVCRISPAVNITKNRLITIILSQWWTPESPMKGFISQPCPTPTCNFFVQCHLHTDQHCTNRIRNQYTLGWVWRFRQGARENLSWSKFSRSIL